MHLSIVTPDRPVFDAEIDSVSLPTPQGEITVLPHHIPLITIVVPGSVLIRQKDQESLIAVSRGVVEIDGQSITILTDTADRVEELEEEAIEKARQAALTLQQERREDAEGFAEATAVIDRELAKLHTIRRHRARRGFTPPTPQ